MLSVTHINVNGRQLTLNARCASSQCGRNCPKRRLGGGVKNDRSSKNQYSMCKKVSPTIRKGWPMVYFLKYDVVWDKTIKFHLGKITTGPQWFPLTIHMTQMCPKNLCFPGFSPFSKKIGRLAARFGAMTFTRALGYAKRPLLVVHAFADARFRWRMLLLTHAFADPRFPRHGTSLLHSYV